MPIINIGRSSANECVLTDSTISRQHARITVNRNGEVSIHDLNSTHGTFVNGRRITDETPLKPGDEVMLGRTVFNWEKAIRTNAGSNGSAPKATRLSTPPSDLTDAQSIGRSSSCDINLPYPDVTGIHAFIGIDASGHPVVEDNSSTNGTYVNGTRINGRRVLMPGDRITICNKYPVEVPKKSGDKGFPLPKTNHWGITAAVAAFALIAIGIGLWWVLRPMSASEIYKKYQNSVVLIYNESAYVPTVNGHTLDEISEDYVGISYWSTDETGKIIPGASVASGTGFFVSDDGKIMTNKHVLYPMGDEADTPDKILSYLQSEFIQEYYKTGNPIYAQIAQNLKVDYRILWTGVARNNSHVKDKSDFIGCTPVKASDDDNVDLAIIQTNTKTTPQNVTIVDCKDISHPDDRRLGDPVYTLGFPKGFIIGTTEVGLEANNQNGTITQERGDYTYGHNISIHQGASGSPVFDRKGRFAGVIVSGFLGISQGYNHAVKPERAADFLR